ncbi:maleylpyruvate isomerase family mycothiol-dependent enzyme [Kitasatospora sp. NPDC051853]|uniref:maleylpyruvate isomerase family mycothiol-dependent enzyme n=1 Tax=Kitasatospora sp. NPDC051853 TaxID=3364058 RepID=UPI00379FB37B
MGAVVRSDAVREHERTRAALAAAVARLGQLLSGARDLDAASGLPHWSVGDTAAHLAAVHLAYSSAVGDEPVDWSGILPDGEGGLLAERIAAVNAKAITLFDGEQRSRIGEFIAERAAAFLDATAGRGPEDLVPTPWYGPERSLTVAAATGLVLSETLLHGLDIARGTGAAWPIGRDEASLVLGQAIPTMMPLALDTARARGVRRSFDLVFDGGLRLSVVVDDGTMTVTRDAAPRAHDCRITADPVTFLLVSFKRAPMWKAIALGRMRAGGRKPWLATSLSKLVATP